MCFIFNYFLLGNKQGIETKKTKVFAGFSACLFLALPGLPVESLHQAPPLDWDLHVHSPVFLGVLDTLACTE